MPSKTQIYSSLAFLAMVSLVNGIRGLRDPWANNGALGELGEYTRWAFDYSHGFTKRGLVGEVFTLFDPQLSVGEVQVLYFVLLLLLVVALVSYYCYFLQNTEAYELIFFSAWGITCTGMIQQYAYDIPRFDIFGILLIISGAFLIERFSSTWPRFLIATFFSFVSVLIHEAFFLWVFPSLLFMFCFFQKDRSFPYVVFLLAAVTIFTLYVGTSSPVGSPPSLASALSKTTSFELRTLRIQPLYRALPESIEYNLNHLNILRDTYDVALGAFCFFFALYPCLRALYSLRTEVERMYAMIYFLLVLCILSPLSLYVVGYDHGRWWAMSMTSFSILFFVVLRGPHGNHIRRLIRSNLHVLVLGIIVNLLLGPSGVTSLFPKSSYDYHVAERVVTFLTRRVLTP